MMLSEKSLTPVELAPGCSPASFGENSTFTHWKQGRSWIGFGNRNFEADDNFIELSENVFGIKYISKPLKQLLPFGYELLLI